MRNIKWRIIKIRLILGLVITILCILAPLCMLFYCDVKSTAKDFFNIEETETRGR